MKATKVIVTITIEGLSIDILPAMLEQAKQIIDGEFENGELIASDGDMIKWKTERKEVEF